MANVQKRSFYNWIKVVLVFNTIVLFVIHCHLSPAVWEWRPLLYLFKVRSSVMWKHVNFCKQMGGAFLTTPILSPEIKRHYLCNILQLKPFNVITFNFISHLFWSHLKIPFTKDFYTKLIGYHHHSVNLIKNAYFQSSHIYRLSLYIENICEIKTCWLSTTNWNPWFLPQPVTFRIVIGDRCFTVFSSAFWPPFFICSVVVFSPSFWSSSSAFLNRSSMPWSTLLKV